MKSERNISAQMVLPRLPPKQRPKLCQKKPRKDLPRHKKPPGRAVTKRFGLPFVKDRLFGRPELSADLAERSASRLPASADLSRSARNTHFPSQALPKKHKTFRTPRLHPLENGVGSCRGHSRIFPMQGRGFRQYPVNSPVYRGRLLS